MCHHCREGISGLWWKTTGTHYQFNLDWFPVNMQAGEQMLNSKQSGICQRYLVTHIKFSTWSKRSLERQSFSFWCCLCLIANSVSVTNNIQRYRCPQIKQGIDADIFTLEVTRFIKAVQRSAHARTDIHPRLQHIPAAGNSLHVCFSREWQ